MSRPPTRATRRARTRGSRATRTDRASLPRGTARRSRGRRNTCAKSRRGLGQAMASWTRRLIRFGGVGTGCERTRMTSARIVVSVPTSRVRRRGGIRNASRARRGARRARGVPEVPEVRAGPVGVRRRTWRVMISPGRGNASGGASPRVEPLRGPSLTHEFLSPRGASRRLTGRACFTNCAMSSADDVPPVRWRGKHPPRGHAMDLRDGDDVKTIVDKRARWTACWSAAN